MMHMTDVLSYRTDKIKELKKLAKEKNISLSQLSSDIIDDYLDYAKLYSRFDRYSDSREIISICFESIDESALDKVLEVSMSEVTSAMKAIGVGSFEEVIDIAGTFFRINSFNLDQFDKGPHIDFVSKNPMPKNWNIYASTVLTKLFKNLGYDGVVESVEKGFFSVKISKQKDP
jgi:hypothetical protein